MSSHPHDPLIGIRLDGRYRITGVLGRGGMGVVYEGVHEELGRAVAIKVLGPDTAAEPLVVERFVREARVASGLAHGNIVDVSDLGRLPDGRPYLVMPQVRGVDFATLLEREGRMAPARVVSLLRGVAAALDLVHAEGLVHRDVKPENLMHVVRADGSENVMLLDFGIAALLGPNAVRLTAEGMRCGTPAYMAPEFIATGEFGPRTDVYAVATVAFEMLTGRLPFNAAMPAFLMDQKMRNTAPSLRAAADGAHFDAALERVVARGLVRDPNLRFSSTGEFVAALENAVVAGADELGVDEPSAVDARTVVVAEPAGAGARSVASMAEVRASSAAAVDRGPGMSPRFGRIARRSILLLGLAVAALVLARYRAPTSQPPPSAPSRIAAQHAQAAAAPSPAALPAEPPPPVPIVDAPVPALAPGAPRALPRAAHRNEPAPAAPEHVTLQRAGAAQEPTAIAPKDESAATGAAGSSLERAADQELLHGHLARAVELFERAIAEDAEDAAAFRGLGLAQERLGHNAAAVRAYRGAIALEPQGAHSAQLRERLQRLLGAHD